MTTAYEARKVMDQARADEWLKANEGQLVDVATPEQSYGERKGYEVSLSFQAEQEELFDTIMDEIVTEEASDVETWEVTTDINPWGYKAEQNVTTLAHWKGVRDTDDSGKPIGTRFVPAKYNTAEKLNKRNRAHFCIEFCFNKNGKVVTAKTALKQRSPEAALEAKKARIAASLAGIEDKRAASLARKAKKLARLEQVARNKA